MNISITKNGKALEKSLYTIDLETRTFSSNEEVLVIDCPHNNWTFKTGYNCTFKTGSNCTFKTGSNCTFKTGSYCTFNTGSKCTFDTGYNCTFKTGYECTFKTGYECTFNTDSNCTFKTGYECTFKTGYECTFNTGYNCTFKTGSECVLVRRDMYEVIEIPENKKIKLKEQRIKGYTFVEEEIKKENMIKIGDKQISESTILEALKKYFGN